MKRLSLSARHRAWLNHLTMNSNAIKIPILQMRKLLLRQVKQLAQWHTA